MIWARNKNREYPVLRHDARSQGSSYLANWRISYAARLALSSALLLALPGGAQTTNAAKYTTPFPAPTGPPLRDSQNPLGDPDSVEQARQLRALNAERLKSMEASADKLLKLARELNDEVSSAHEDSLTPDQLHKVAQIEKLAHSVREDMAKTMQGSAFAMPPPQEVP